MSSRHINILKTADVTWTYQVSADSDKVSSTLKYADKFEGWASRCPLLGSEHPDLNGLLLVGIKAARQPGDLIEVNLDYSTNNSDADYPGKPPGEPVPRYSVRFAGGEEHILANAYAAELEVAEQKALLAISNGSEADESGAKWETSITTDLGLSILAKIRKGNVSYKTGSLAYIERKIITDLVDIEYSKLGKIDSPPGGVGGGENTWLYESASAEPDESGESWSLERVWIYSPNGWDADLYSVTE